MKHKTARGRVIDMSALAKQNEEMRAVSPGNQNLNARGDRLDKSGNVVQTVQSKARVQAETTVAPEKRKLSAAPGAPKPTKKKAAAEPVVEPTEPATSEIVREEEKERSDGTRYVEIEFADGSMDVKELD